MRWIQKGKWKQEYKQNIKCETQNGEWKSLFNSLNRKTEISFAFALQACHQKSQGEIINESVLPFEMYWQGKPYKDLQNVNT